MGHRQPPHYTAANTFLGRVIPFLGLGIFFVVIIIAFIFFSYILLLGGLIGLILFGVAYIKEKFFAPKKKAIPKTGRTYDHDKF